jgi:hypothetical protein
VAVDEDAGDVVLARVVLGQHLAFCGRGGLKERGRLRGDCEQVVEADADGIA